MALSRPLSEERYEKNRSELREKHDVWETDVATVLEQFRNTFRSEENVNFIAAAFVVEDCVKAYGKKVDDLHILALDIARLTRQYSDDDSSAIRGQRPNRVQNRHVTTQVEKIRNFESLDGLVPVDSDLITRRTFKIFTKSVPRLPEPLALIMMTTSFNDLVSNNEEHSNFTMNNCSRKKTGAHFLPGVPYSQTEDEVSSVSHDPTDLLPVNNLREVNFDDGVPIDEIPLMPLNLSDVSLMTVEDTHDDENHQTPINIAELHESGVDTSGSDNVGSKRKRGERTSMTLRSDTQGDLSEKPKTKNQRKSKKKKKISSYRYSSSVRRRLTSNSFADELSIENPRFECDGDQEVPEVFSCLGEDALPFPSISHSEESGRTTISTPYCGNSVPTPSEPIFATDPQHDDSHSSSPRGESRSDRIIQNKIDAYLDRISVLDSSTTYLSREVVTWEKKMKPILEETEARSTFDCRRYADQLLTHLDNLPKINFRDFCAGKEPWELGRYFVASLQLVTEQTIALHQEDEDRGLELSYFFLSF